MSHYLHRPIDRRQILHAGSTLGLCALLAACGARGPSTETKRPNFLFLPIDDLNDWIGALGTNLNVKTPNIDALAKRGVLFENAHAQAPICGPSRASLLSGLYPHQTGIYGQVAGAEQLRSAIRAVSPTPFLTESLKAHGYYAAARGKIFHKDVPSGTFDEHRRDGDFGPKPAQDFKWESNHTHTDWGPFPETDAEMIDIQTAEWGADWLAKPREKPFFLGLGMIRPHVPWHVPKKWFDLYPLDAITLPPWLENDMADVPPAGLALTDVPQMPTIDWAIETGEWRPILQAYLASVTFVDHCIGIALDALAKSDHADNTYIILFSDNGYHLGEKSRFAKMSLWERSTRVPLIIAGPGITPNRSRVPVGLIDLYPTILELAGLPVNADNAGESLVPILNGMNEARGPVTSVYGEGNFAVVNANYRYIRYADGSEELYDRKTDPNEWMNIADEPRFAAVKRELANHMPSDAQPAIVVERVERELIARPVE